jgi:ferritin-like metal-binding protein YciE
MLVFEVLPHVIRTAGDQPLVEALVRHFEETRMHVQRVERAVRSLSAEPSSNRSASFAALAAQGDEVAGKIVEPRLRDLHLAWAAARTEHFELALYGALEPLLSVLGAVEAVGLLEESRGGEERALADAEAASERLARS